MSGRRLGALVPALVLLVASCDSPTAPPDISVSILMPSDGMAFWQDEGIPCESAISPTEYSSDTVWYFSGSQADCAASGLVLSNPEVGEHEVVVSVREAEVVSADTVHVSVRERIPPEVSILEPEDDAVLFAGDTIVFRGEASDPYVETLADEEFVWESNVDGVLGNGKLLHHTLSDGTHSVRLSVRGSSELTGHATTQVDVLPVIEGTVFPLGPRAGADERAEYAIEPSEGIRVIARAEGTAAMLARASSMRSEPAMSTESVPVDRDGHFVLRTELIRSETLEVCILAENDDYYSACVKGDVLDQAMSEDALAVILVPRRYLIPTGVRAGTDVEIDLEAALDRGEGSFTWSSFYWTTWRNEVRSIPRENRPLVAAIDRDNPDHDGQMITAQDSINLWESLRTFEEYVGLGELFTPGTADQLGDRTGVKIISDSTRSPYARSHFDSNDNITGGRISVKWVYQLESTETLGTTMHEALHVIGAGHTCYWESLMLEGPLRCPPDSEYPGSRSVYLPSAKDVAHIQILYLSREAQADLNAPFGIMATEAARRAIEKSWHTTFVLPFGSRIRHGFEVWH